MSQTQLILEKEAKRGKGLYVIEAALEYFVTIIVGGQNLTNLSLHLGLDQSLSSILLSFVQLGYVFQLFGLLLARKKRIKRLATTLSVLSEAAFALIYLVPFSPISKAGKHLLFIAFLLVGYIVSNFIGSPKLNMYMSFVGTGERGRFTAKKEMCSLAGGVVFSYLVSFVIEHFEKINQIETAFVISAIAILLLSVGHMLVLIFTPDVEVPTSNVSFTKTVKTAFFNKKTWKVYVVQIIYSVISTTAIACIVPYLKYPTSEFGLGVSSEIFFTTVAAIGALTRVLVSRPMGKFADKYTFKTSTSFCYGLLGLALLAAAFINPTTGVIFYIVYMLIHSVAMAGTNSGIINLLYEEVEPEQRIGAYAVQQFVAGIIAFGFSFLSAAFIKAVQSSSTSGTLLGLYAQQWLFLWGALLAGLLVLYVQLVLKKKKQN